MRLHLDRDRDEPLLWEETVTLEPAELGPDLISELSPIEVRGRVDKIDADGGERVGGVRSRTAAAAGPASFQIGFDLHYTQGLPCTRCLQPVRSEVTSHADLMVDTRATPVRSTGGAKGTAAKAQAGKAKKSAASEKRAAKESSKKARARHEEPEVELDKDELGVLTIDGEHLDTEPLIVEQILLELPMKPLCTPECKGLCPRCGADRNLVADCCEEPAGDERWEALGALRDQLSAEKR